MATVKSIKAASVSEPIDSHITQERIDLAIECVDRTQQLGRALAIMRADAFDDDKEDSPWTHYATVAQEIGFRVRELSCAAQFLLADSQYDQSTAWEVLHGRG